jgi:hypothetical protein
VPFGKNFQRYTRAYRRAGAGRKGQQRREEHQIRHVLLRPFHGDGPVEPRTDYATDVA